jgi:hypothetical protein
MLLVIGRTITATIRLSDGRNCNRTGRDQGGEGACVTGRHIPIPPVEIAIAVLTLPSRRSEFQLDIGRMPT